MDIISQQLRPQFDYIRTLEKACGIALSDDEEIVAAAGIYARRMPGNDFIAAIEVLVFELETIAMAGGLPCQH